MALDVHHVAAPPSPCPGVARALELLAALEKARLDYVAALGAKIDIFEAAALALVDAETALTMYDAALGLTPRSSYVRDVARPDGVQRNPRWREALDALNRKMGRQRAPLAGGGS